MLFFFRCSFLLLFLSEIHEISIIIIWKKIPEKIVYIVETRFIEICFGFSLFIFSSFFMRFISIFESKTPILYFPCQFLKSFIKKLLMKKCYILLQSCVSVQLMTTLSVFLQKRSYFAKNVDIHFYLMNCYSD